MNIHRRDFLWLSGAAAAFSAMPSFAAEDGEPLRIEVFARKGKNSLKQDEDQVGIFGKEGSPLTGKAEEA